MDSTRRSARWLQRRYRNFLTSIDKSAKAEPFFLTEVRWPRASATGAAGIRCCDLRYPESVGIIRVVSGDGEQEMSTVFFPQIQDSLSISGRPADKVLPAFAMRGNVLLGDSPIAHVLWRADSETVVVAIA